LNHQVAQIFTIFLYVIIAAVIVRSLLSWFPNGTNSQLGRLLHQFTEPLLEPVRRIMPRTGMIDLSAMVVIIVLYIMISVVNQAASS
jgi:YggT family protein